MSLTKTFTFLILALALVVSTFGLVSATDLFNANDGSVSGWTITNTPTTLPGSAWADAGDFMQAMPGAAGTDGTSTIERTISTSGFNSIVVKYDRQLGEFESTDNFVVAWSTGGAYTNLESVTTNAVADPSFVTKTFNLPSDANNNANFKLKIVCTTSAADESCKVDNLTVTGTAIPTTPTNFCSTGIHGASNLSVEITKIDNSGEGSDTDWEPLDTIEVKVNVENIGTGKVKDINVKLGLFDASGRNQIGDLDFSNSDEEEISVGDLKEGKDEDAIFEFTVPADFDKDSYDLVAKAFEDGKESTLCVDTSDIDEGISVVDPDDQRAVVVSEIILPTEATCGETVTGTFRVFNIGSDDQDQILVRTTNKDLALDQTQEIKENVDEGDSKLLDFTFTIPRSLSDRTYPISFTTEYDYRNGNYHEKSQDVFTGNLKLIGCSGSPTPGNGNSNVAVSATLDSDAVAGKEMVVSAVIRNTGTTTQSFIIDAEGFESWGDLSDLSDRIVTLEPGKIKAITLTFMVNEDASGTESFDITTTSNGATSSQPVEFSIEKASGSNFNLSGNGLIWVIGAVNVILVLLIIFVAIKLSRR